MKTLFKFHFSTVRQLLVVVLFAGHTMAAAEEGQTVRYVSIDPIIVTNYQTKSLKKLGFIQLSAQLSVLTTDSEVKLLHHMPLVRDYIVEFLNFTDAEFIKDVKKRKQFRKKIAAGIQKMLTDEIGEPLIEELIITRYMWN